jgi:hypothetical protein
MTIVYATVLAIDDSWQASDDVKCERESKMMELCEVS